VRVVLCGEYYVENVLVMCTAEEEPEPLRLDGKAKAREPCAVAANGRERNRRRRILIGHHNLGRSFHRLLSGQRNSGKWGVALSLSLEKGAAREQNR